MTTTTDDTLDPRRHAWRADLADIRLKDRVSSPRYSSGEIATVMRAAVPLRRTPVGSAAFETEALYGERVLVFDTADGWSWIQLDRDGYVGYVPADTVARNQPPATHRIKAIGTFVYPVPDIKSPPMLHLSLNAGIVVAETGDRFYRLDTGGYVVARHVADVWWTDRDFVEVAERFIGTPYLWGGKTRVGIDCSGLVQVSLQSCGYEVPRDSDLQRAEIGTEIDIPPDLEGLDRGDLVFWRGHVGIMSDGLMLLHANAHHMAVVIEPLPEAAARIRTAGLDITAVRRLPSLSRSV
jgi:cell wall-associated NlpC family hydrolase